MTHMSLAKEIAVHRPDLGKLINHAESMPLDEADRQIVTALVVAAKQVVERMNQIEPNLKENRKGGVLAVGRSGFFKPFLVTEAVGEMPAPNPSAEKELDQNKLIKYVVYVWSKLAVLVLYQSELSSGLAAAQTSVLDSQGVPKLNIDKAPIPGGAVRISHQERELLISFSGYSTGEDDEVVVLAACVLAKVLERDRALELAVQMKNSRFLTLLPQLID